MASLKAARSLSKFPIGGMAGGAIKHTAWGLYTFAANPTAADTVDLFRLPAGALAIGGWMRGVDLDTGTDALDIDIGWTANGGSGVGATADPDGFGNFGVVAGTAVTNFKPEASILFPLNGTLKSGPIYFDKETLVQAVVNVTANAGGTGIFWVSLDYLFQDPTTSAQT
jgi:hypothetical protein